MKKYSIVFALLLAVGLAGSAGAAPAQRIVVARSGGDFTSISDALASISPSADNPYVIDVMPGTYRENVVLKSYVHLHGAGNDVTTVEAPGSGYTIASEGIRNVTVSGFTITGGYAGIELSQAADITIRHNRLTGNGMGISASAATITVESNEIVQNRSYGIYVSGYSGPTNVIVRGNTISRNQYYGIVFSYSSGSIIDNVISNNTYDGIWTYSSGVIISGNEITYNTRDGIAESYYSTSTITDNVIRNNQRYGLSNNSWSRPKIMHNRITENGGTTYTDIYVNDSTTSTPYRPTISFNMYDNITGSGGVGLYNVNSQGGAAPAP